MKAPLCLPLIALLFSPLSHAHSKLIVCSSPDNQGFSLVIGKVVKDLSPIETENDGFASDLHPRNVAIRPLPITVRVRKVSTRAIAGEAYALALPNGDAVRLQNITFASPSNREMLGISGEANLKDGGEISLKCE